MFVEKLRSDNKVPELLEKSFVVVSSYPRTDQEL